MHIDLLTTKLSTACYVIIKPLMSHKTLLGIYNSLFLYSHELRNNILGKFLSQYINFSDEKERNQNITGCGNSDSYRIVLKKQIFCHLRHNTYFLYLVCAVNNRNLFFINSEIHSINTRQCANLYLLSANLDIYQKGVHYSGITIFKTLSFNIKKFSHNLRIFKSLSNFLSMNSFCSFDKYCNNSGI